MRHILKSSFVLIVVCSSASLFAQYTYTATTSANSTVVGRDITWTEIQTLSFPDIASPASAGTLRPWHHPSGGIVNAGIAEAGRLTIHGQPEYVVGFNLPSDGEVTLSDGTNTMPLTDFRESGTEAEDGSFTLDTGGAYDFWLLATLHVEANQPPGNYSAVFNIIFHYN